ncbi:hypothetical protein JNB63_20855, partial [Microbacterium trichothecenolyticum]|uniref:GMC family oxidoreductase n=1 Tax=Microbacterium trichothecenolyticum TaxID=69370 RepID=UPI001C6DF941
KVVSRWASRFALRVMATEAAQKVVFPGSVPRQGHPSANVDSSDEELDALNKAYGVSWYHPGGTASMGKVVDGECRVIGAKGLRVVDASILPCPLSGHYQAPMYGIAERAAEMIVQAAG